MAPRGCFPGRGTGPGRTASLLSLMRWPTICALPKSPPLQRLFTDNSAIIVLEGVWTVRATGKEVRAVGANIFTLRGAQISRYQVFTDTAAFGMGLGKLSPASS